MNCTTSCPYTQVGCHNPNNEARGCCFITNKGKVRYCMDHPKAQAEIKEAREKGLKFWRD